jgi:SAM-dependent methyltransferase
VNSIPRLLRPDLLAHMRSRHAEFFARHPEFLSHAEQNGAGDPFADTIESFNRTHVDLPPPGLEFIDQWKEQFNRYVGRALTPAFLRGKLVLDIGCGFGRHLYLASQAGAEVVGVDLSGGVDVARHHNADHPRCHIVQANVYDRPLRDDRFDVVWSFGVLHHMPDPRAGFDAIVPFARHDGGLVTIWVYGYRGMSFSYRLSHMRMLHRMTRALSHRARVRISMVVAALLSGLYWEPLRLARRLGLQNTVERLPLSVYADHGWIERVSGVSDRLTTPITHFHDRDELFEWFRSAGLSDIVVEDTERRGWRAYGYHRAALRPAPTAALQASAS